jgi:hypothetical protein
MSLFDRFYRVKTKADVLTKTASADFVNGAVAAKLAFWQEAKRRAATDAGGLYVGLAKAAMTLRDDAQASGVKTASAPDDALPFAASFASAALVDAAIAKLAAAGELSSTEIYKLAALNACSAFDDLEKIAFGIQDLLHLAQQNPHVTGMMVGAAIGAGVGALNDGEDHVRGALAGAALGTAVGGLGGQLAKDVRPGMGAPGLPGAGGSSRVNIPRPHQS